MGTVGDGSDIIIQVRYLGRYDDHVRARRMGGTDSPTRTPAKGLMCDEVRCNTVVVYI